MSKILIILNTAFDVSTVRSIPVNNTDTRTTQYIEGFKSFFKFDYYKYPHDITFVVSDNTINNKNKIDPKILNEIPDNVLFDLREDNIFGSKNKGAGVLTSWKRCNELIMDNDFVLHFEPRLLLIEHTLIEKFLNQPTNIFTIGSNGKHFNTGLFGCHKDVLIKFINHLTPEQMYKYKISLENTLFNFINASKTDLSIEDKMGVIWHDSHTGKLHKM
jgi:hypothetical protein